LRFCGDITIFVVRPGTNLSAKLLRFEAFYPVNGTAGWGDVLWARLMWLARLTPIVRCVLFAGADSRPIVNAEPWLASLDMTVPLPNI